MPVESIVLENVVSAYFYHSNHAPAFAKSSTEFTNGGPAQLII
jgi:hypothetical protein